MRIGLSEIIVIIVIVLALFDPNKLKHMSEKLGKTVSIISKTAKQINDDVVQPIQDDVIKPVKDAAKPVTDLHNEVNNTINMFDGGK